MSTPSNDVLANMIQNLTKVVEDGFKGVHERQDLTNGKVKANSEFRIKQQTNNRWVYGICTCLAIPIAILIIKVYLTK